MQDGWVYVLVNSSIPGLAKVGCTTRAAAERAAELSAVTGVATPFVVAFDQHFTDCQAAERSIHAELDRRGLRVTPNREFFRGAPSDIIRVVLEQGQTGERVYPPDRLSVATLLATGDRALHGLGDALQDTGEAVRCFRLAASRGSLEAFERLGAIYSDLYAGRRDQASRRRALAPLKEGVRRGNPYCYCEMAALFASEGHLANFAKAWALFFAGKPAARDEAAARRYTAACCRYVGLCLELRLQPGHGTELRAAGETMLIALLAELDQTGQDAMLRQRLVATLRWVHALLAQASAAEPASVWQLTRRWWRWSAAPDAATA